jgi:hypothetical protein
MIPLPIEDVTLDFHLLAHHVITNTSDVLVAAAPTTYIQNRLELSKEAGIAKVLIDVDVFALFAYLQFHRAYRKMPDNVAMVDIGATQISVCLTSKDRPSTVRTILWGSEKLTEAIAQRYGCSRGEAEQKKRQTEAHHLEPSLSPLVDALRVSLHAYESNTRTTIQHLLLCGGGSRLGSVGEFLGRELGLIPLSLTATPSIECPSEFAVAFGSAVRASMSRRVEVTTWRRAVSPIVAIDLGRAIKRSQSRTEWAKRHLVFHGIGICLLAILSLTDLSVRVFLAESRVQQLRTTVQEQAKQHFPGMNLGLDPVDQARMELESLKKGLLELGVDQPSMLKILTGLAQAMPASQVHKVTLLSMEAPAIQLEAEASSFESVERVKEHLKNLPRLINVKVTDARAGATPNQVLFRLAIYFEN